MPQHVAVDREQETSSLAGTGNHPLIARNAQWRTPLGNKDVDARIRSPASPTAVPAPRAAKPLRRRAA
jgi:hypothetical protein